MARSKINKKSKPIDPLKARCLRGIVFNSKSAAGNILSPKRAVEGLREKKAVLQFQIDSGTASPEIQQQFTVVEEELRMGEKFLASEAKRTAAMRENTTRNKRLQTVVASLHHLSREELLQVKIEIETLLATNIATSSSVSVGGTSVRIISEEKLQVQEEPLPHTLKTVVEPVAEKEPEKVAANNDKDEGSSVIVKALEKAATATTKKPEKAVAKKDKAEESSVVAVETEKAAPIVTKKPEKTAAAKKDKGSEEASATLKAPEKAVSKKRKGEDTPATEKEPEKDLSKKRKGTESSGTAKETEKKLLSKKVKGNETSVTTEAVSTSTSTSVTAKATDKRAAASKKDQPQSASSSSSTSTKEPEKRPSRSKKTQEGAAKDVQEEEPSAAATAATSSSEPPKGAPFKESAWYAKYIGY